MVFDDDPQTQSNKEVNIKKSLQQSYSNEEKQLATGMNPSAESIKEDNQEEVKDSIQQSAARFDEDVGAVDEVIEEKDEEQEEERKTGNPERHSRQRVNPA